MGIGGIRLGRGVGGREYRERQLELEDIAKGWVMWIPNAVETTGLYDGDPDKDS